MKSDTSVPVSRIRWAAIGAAVAVTVGAGGLMTASASISSGERAVYVPITPCRVMDTRPGTDTVGTRTAPLAAGDVHTISVTGHNGNCTLPLDAVGVVMNVAAVDPTQSSFLTVYPADAPRPLSANLNWVSGQPPVSNAVTSDISADGKISFYNLAGSVNLSADIVGYYVDHNHDDRYLSKISFAQAVSTSTIAATDTEITKLSDVGAGGALVVQNSVRIVLTGTVTVGNSAGTGEFSIVSCQFQMANNGGAFAAVGSAQTTESIGNNNHDQTADVALVAVTDRPAGSYNVRVVCRVTFGTASSGPRARSVGVSVVASPV